MQNQSRTYSELILFTILFLFFMELLVDFVGAIYARGLLQTSIPVEIVSVVLLFSPLALLAWPDGLRGWPLTILGEVTLICRVFEVVLDKGPKMVMSGLGVGCFLVLLPALLHQQARAERESNSFTLGVSFTIALALLILFRVGGSGLDLAVTGGTQAIGLALALLAAVMLIGISRPDELPARGRGSRPALKLPATFGRILALSVGIFSVIILVYFAFSSPNVIARWTGVSYPLIVVVMLVSLSGCAGIFLRRPTWLSWITPPRLLAANALFLLSLVGTLLAHQIRFPANPAAYPLAQPAVGVWAYLPLLLMLLLFPLLLLDLILFLRDLTARKPTMRSLAGGFTLASLFLLILVLAQVFTTVYDYIPVVGPFFRDKFWLVFLVAGLGVAPALLVVDPAMYTLEEWLSRLVPPPWLVGVMPAFALLTIMALLITPARPAPPAADADHLRILTFNIQQGYSEDGRKNVAGQLALMQAANADVIGLQESDTNRIAGSNDDVVRYLADQLDMYAYYGPPVTAGTFGIALLSRYPLQNADTFYMYSEGEQTAAIQAQISVSGQTFNLFVTHLGNGGPIVQQEALLQRIDGLPNVVALGDFNFRPDSDPYRLTTTTLEDAYLTVWPTGIDSAGIDARERIDHVFISPGLTVNEADYLETAESDHPAVLVEVGW